MLPFARGQAQGIYTHYCVIAWAAAGVRPQGGPPTGDWGYCVPHFYLLLCCRAVMTIPQTGLIRVLFEIRSRKNKEHETP